MPMQWGTVPIPLGIAGIDTRTDPKMVSPPKLRRLENSSLRTPGRLAKRYGSRAIGGQLQLVFGDSLGLTAGRVPVAISGAKGLMRFRDNLLMETATDILAYNAALDRWVPIGPAPTFQVTYEPGASAAPLTGVEICDMATADGLLVTAMIGSFGGTVGGLTISIRDLATGQEFIHGISGDTKVRCVAVGDAVYVFSRGTGGEVQVVIVSKTTMALWASGPPQIVVTADYANATDLFDVAASGGRILLTYYNDAGTISFGYVTPSGAFDGAMSTETPSAAPNVLGCAVEPTTRRFAIFWGIDAAGGSDRVRMFAEDKTALFAATSLGDGGPTYKNMAGAFTSSGVLHVLTEFSAVAATNYQVFHQKVTSAGSVDFATDGLRHCGMASKPWVSDGIVYAILVHESALQPSFFIWRGSDNAGYGPGPVGGPYATVRDYAVLGRLFPDEAAGLWTRSYLPNVIAMGGGLFRYPARVLGIHGEDPPIRVSDVVLDAATPASWVDVGDCLLGTGAQLWATDGGRVSEVGFLRWPESVIATPSNAAGALTPSATYTYRVYRERNWPDGRREQSTALDVSVTMGVADDTVTLTIPTLATATDWTPIMGPFGGGDGAVTYGIYRANPGETVFHRVSEIVQGLVANGYVFDDFSADSVTFVDELSDAAIADNETDYLSASEAQNIAPPPVSLIAAGNGRVFLGGLADPNLFWHSKTRESGEPPAFSFALAFAVDPGDGRPTGSAVLADSFLAFREHEVYLVGGDGPSNVLLADVPVSGEWTPARILSADLGCVNARSIVRIPIGVIFQSHKGLYVIDNELSLAYIGAGVEGELEGETITSAVALSDNHEVRFTLASGKTLVYDYLAQAWTTSTIGGLSACLWQRQWVVLADSTGKVLVEDPTLFADAGLPYNQRIEWPPIHIGGLQGAQRARRLLFAGEYRSRAAPRVWVSFDDEDAWYGPYAWSAADVVNTNTFGSDPTYGSGVYGGTGASGRYQFEVKLPRQKCQTLHVRLEDAADGEALGEGFRLSEMALEIGTRLNSPSRLPASRRATKE